MTRIEQKKWMAEKKRYLGRKGSVPVYVFPLELFEKEGAEKLLEEEEKLNIIYVLQSDEGKEYIISEEGELIEI